MPDSFDYTTGTNSENVRLLQALIDDAPEYTEETNSRNANILKSIINNTEYTDAPQSEIEELLLRLKAKIGGEIEVDELTVTENGTYDAGVNKAYNPVTVELPLDSKTITENGTYTASSDNLAGFNEVTVAVEGYAKKSIPNTPTAIATFNASALPMPSLKIGIEAVQDLHGYDNPWPAGGGKNKFDISKVVTNAEVVNNGTSLSLTTNPQTNNCTAGSPNKLKDYCPTLKEGDTVTFSFKSTGDRKYIYLLGYNDQWNSGTSKTITASMLNSTVLWYTSQGVSTATVSEIQFEIGSTASSFAPYSNICPISGWSAVNVYDTGINMWDEEWEVGDIDASGNPQPSSTLIRTKNFNPCKPNTTYKVVIPSGVSMYMKYYDKDKNFISPTVSAGSTITPPSNCYYFKFVIGSAYGTTYNNDISINYPSTDTDYHAYNGQTYTTALKDGQGNPLTCYGGTLSNENGVQTLDDETKIVVFDGSSDENWNFVQGGFFIENALTGINGLTSKTTPKCMCNMYIEENAIDVSSELPTKEDFSFLNQSGNYISRLWVKDSRYSTVEDFKTALASHPLQIRYTLAPPQTIPQDSLSIATQNGTNNLWADSGDIQSGEYMEAL